MDKSLGLGANEFSFQFWVDPSRKAIDVTTISYAGVLFLIGALAISQLTLAQGPSSAGVSTSASQSASLSSGGKFVSLEGRFSIGLPSTQHGFRKLAIPTPFGVARGDAYYWQLKEGSFVAGHADASRPLDTPEVSKQVFDLLREATKRLAQENSGVVGSEKLFELDKHPGIEQRLELFTGTMIQRTYLASRRIYQTLAVVKTTQRAYQPMAISALDTFRILTDADIVALLAENVAKAEPSPLPQAPASNRIATDASHNNLFGPVKTVLEERQDLTGTGFVQSKKRNSFDQYDEKGNFIRREVYDYRGNLDMIKVFGYIDGARVSKSNSVRHEYNPPPMTIPDDPSKPVRKSDSRYDTKYEFKYDDKKRLIEEKWFRNNGELFSRVAHKYDGNQVETLIYSSSGELIQNYVKLLDEKRNEVEKTARDPRDGALGAKYTYSYEYDSEGNWIKRTTSKVTSKDGVSKSEPQYVDVRTITYY